MARKTNLAKTIERYLPRKFEMNIYHLEELIAAIKSNYEKNPYEFKRDYQVLEKLAEMRETCLS